MIAPTPFPGQGPIALPRIPYGQEDQYWYAVARISDGEILYSGRAIDRANAALGDPGTCYAVCHASDLDRGDWAVTESLARQAARWFRDQERRRREQTPDGSGHAPQSGTDSTGTAA